MHRKGFFYFQEENVDSYEDFLKGKIVIAPQDGFKVDRSEVFETKTSDFIEEPHQVDAVLWAVEGGRRALFESFGLGKTIQVLSLLLLVKKERAHPSLLVVPASFVIRRMP